MLYQATSSFANGDNNFIVVNTYVTTPAPCATQFIAHAFAQTKMGRDHTIFATAPGFVRFYKQKHGMKDRKYVGLVLERGEKLPRDESAQGRSRFFGMANLTERRKEDAAAKAELP